MTGQGFVLTPRAMTAAASLAARMNARPLGWRVGAVVLGACVMALASQVEFPVGPVPITLQTFGLFVVAGLGGGAVALGAVLVWLAAAALGAPVLAGGAHGWPALMGYTAGFLAGMAAAAWICGRAAEKTRGVWRLTALFLAGHLIVLAVGWAGLLAVMDPGPAFTVGILPFLPGAAVKSLAAAAVVSLVSR